MTTTEPGETTTEPGETTTEPGEPAPPPWPEAAGAPTVAQRHLLGAERTLIVARWLGVAFGLLQIRFYGMPTPEGVEARAYLLVGVLAAVNVAASLAVRRPGGIRRARALAMTMLAVDVLVVTAFVWLYSFDQVSVHFLLFFVLPAEAALKFGLAGTLVTGLVITGLYVAREAWAAATYGHVFSPPSISYRMGILLIVSFTTGAFARWVTAMSRQATEALEERRREEQWRSALIDMLAHDLRSPIGTATSMLQLVEQRADTLDPAQTSELISKAIRQNRRALDLTDDLLTMARMRQGQLETQPEPIDVAEFLHRLVRETFGDDDWIEIDVAADLRVHADPRRLGQMLANLLLNARKHGRPPVVVTTRPAGPGEATIRVTDSGGGVAPERRETLFDPFSAGADAGSVGLGLWVVHTLAVAHGGDAWYEHAPEGPTFAVRLPTGP